MSSIACNAMLSQISDLIKGLERLENGEVEAGPRAFHMLMVWAKNIQETIERDDVGTRQAELDKRLGSTRALEKKAEASRTDASLKLLDALEKQTIAIALLEKLRVREKATAELEAVLDHRDRLVSVREEETRIKESELTLRESQAVEKAYVLETKDQSLKARSDELARESERLEARLDELTRGERMLTDSRADIHLREEAVTSKEIAGASKEASIALRETAMLVGEERCQGQGDRKAALDRRMDEVCRREAEVYSSEIALRERQSTLDRLEKALLEGTEGDGTSLQAKLGAVAAKLDSVQSRTVAKINMLGQQITGQFANQSQEIGLVGARTNVRNDEVSEEIAQALRTIRNQVGRQISNLIKEFVDSIERLGRQFGTQLVTLDGQVTSKVTELDDGLAAKIAAMGSQISDLGERVQQEHTIQEDGLDKLVGGIEKALADIAGQRKEAAGYSAELVDKVNAVRDGISASIVEQRREAAGYSAELVDKMNSVRDNVDARIARQREEAAGQIANLVQKMDSVSGDIAAGITEQRKEALEQNANIVAKMDSVHEDLSTDIAEAGGCVLRILEEKTDALTGEIQAFRDYQRSRFEALKADMLELEDGTLLQQLVEHSYNIVRGAWNTRAGDSILGKIRDDLQLFIGDMLHDVIRTHSESPANLEGMLCLAAKAQRRVNGNLKDVAATVEDVSRKCTDIWMANRLPKRPAEVSAAEEPAAKRVRGYLNAKEAGEMTFDRFTSGISLVMGCVKLNAKGGATPSGVFSQLITIIRDHANTDNLLEFLAEKGLHSRQPYGRCLAGLAYLGWENEAVVTGECQCEQVLAPEELMEVCLVIEKVDDEAYGNVSLRWRARTSTAHTEQAPRISIMASLDIKHLDMRRLLDEGKISPEEILTELSEIWPLIEGVAPAVNSALIVVRHLLAATKLETHALDKVGEWEAKNPLLRMAWCKVEEATEEERAESRDSSALWTLGMASST
ncbi:hypothetical protein PspLS_11227 [Pyricularia sp. CBS 133598]|nr:hypothetical protein PspLS_11227 [Pyricularia sp. CBS 133598]